MAKYLVTMEILVEVEVEAENEVKAVDKACEVCSKNTDYLELIDASDIEKVEE